MTSQRRYASKTAAERRGDRRARLLECAVEAFGTSGYRATTIESLCTGAGVSTRNFYEEFESREQLLIAVHDDINERVFAAVLEALAGVDSDDLAARARAATRAYFDVMTSDRRWARIAVVESVGVSPEVEAARRAAINRFVTLIELESERLAAAGVIARRPFGLTAVALAGAIYGLVNTWAGEENWDAQVPAIAEEAARLVVLGIAG